MLAEQIWFGRQRNGCEVREERRHELRSYVPGRSEIGPDTGNLLFLAPKR